MIISGFKKALLTLAMLMVLPTISFAWWPETGAEVPLSELKSEVDYLLPAHNETLLPSSYLEKLNKAFQSIREKTAKYKDQNDKIPEFLFDGFSILVKLP